MKHAASVLFAMILLFTMVCAAQAEPVQPLPSDSVLALQVFDSSGEFLRTGYGAVILEDPALITNAHILENAARITAVTSGGQELEMDAVLAADLEKDLAVLSFAAPDAVAPLKTADPAQMKTGDGVTVVLPGTGAPTALTPGTFLTAYPLDGTDFVQFAASLPEDRAQGVVLDENGAVLGLVSTSLGGQMALAVSAEEIQALCRQTDKAPVSIRDFIYYPEIAEGGEGEAVLKVQKALSELGYTLNPGSVYDEATQEAVSAFCTLNGLQETRSISPAMQQLLFAGEPVPFSVQEQLPETAETASSPELQAEAGGDDKSLTIMASSLDVDFATNSSCQWVNLSGDKLKVRFQVANFSRRQVTAVELYVYAEDVWGNEIYGNNVYYATSRIRINPGKMVYSDYMVIPNRSRIDTIYCGVHKVRFADGTIMETDNVHYWYWTYR